MNDQALSWAVWFDAAGRPEVDRRLAALWSDLADEIAQRPEAVCRASGRCCRFEQFGHRLYVTALEIAWVVGSDPFRQSDAPLPQQAQINRRLAQGIDAWAGGCPFQMGQRCLIHRVRPLGCRVFFCAVGTDAWQHELYEKNLTAIRQLHDQLNLPYAYLEWRIGLSQALAHQASR